jgi:hypothetical protein
MTRHRASTKLLIAREQEQTQHLPRRPGKVTLIRIQDGRVTSITYADSASAIKSLL